MILNFNKAELPIDKKELYKTLGAQAHALVEDEGDAVANAANLSSLLFYGLPEVNWVGFYFLRGDTLIVGPFQGKPACARIPMGRGVCGTAASERQTQVVADVNAFPGHIFCDTAARSEIVVPLMKHNEVLGVLDLDAPVTDRFDDEDRVGLELIAAIWMESLTG